MSSNAPTNNKIHASNPTSASSFSQGPSSTSGEASQKRSGSTGATSQSRFAPQPRIHQPSKRQHRTTPKRARLVDGDATEAAAMRSVNSRKGQTSITHLLNFSLPPRPLPQPHYPNHRVSRRNWGLGSGYHAVDKARYVHANYRFIVKPEGDYRVHALDADVYLKWDQILQVLASADTQSTECPICLSKPVAPRMAKCGHIACLPCLIRYMHSSDEATVILEKRARWKKCPICEDSIYISDTRPVRWFEGQEASMLREGGDVLLKLLMRHPGTTMALPRDAAEAYGHPQDIPWFHVAEIMDYARIMKGSEEYMKSQYDQEILDLRQQEVEDELMFGDDNTWTQKAVASVESAKNKVEGIGGPPHLKSQAIEVIDDVPESWDAEVDSQNTQSVSDSALSSGMQRLAVQQYASATAKHPFFFYHALPNFFLSPLDIRILKTAFGDFDAFPSTILPRVEHISTGHVVDDDLRKRAKYMAHLPYGCEVSFLECDWTDIISPTILTQFKDEIGKRRKRNTDKEAREEKDRLRAERREEEEKWASIRSRRPDVTSKSFSETDFVPLASSLHDEGAATTPPWGAHRTHSSFATLASPGTSPDAPRTVWGTAAVAATSPALEPVIERPHVDDGWLQDWEKDLLDESDAVAMVEANIAGVGAPSRPSAAGKKGKKKKITLMSTNNRRGA